MGACANFIINQRILSMSVCIAVEWTSLQVVCTIIQFCVTWEASLVAQTVKSLCAMQETRIRSLGWEDPLEKETAAHSSILAWKIPWTMEPGRLQSMGSQRVGHDSATSLTWSHNKKANEVWTIQLFHRLQRVKRQQLLHHHSIVKTSLVTTVKAKVP